MQQVKHLNEQAFDRLAAEPTRGPIAMLNLLKFKPAGGRERYADYVAGVAPLLQKVGARIAYAGECGAMVIGTQDWDLMAVVEYPSVGAFTAMIQSAEYQAIAPIRDEALERSVLYETTPVSLALPAD